MKKFSWKLPGSSFHILRTPRFSIRYTTFNRVESSVMDRKSVGSDDAVFIARSYDCLPVNGLWEFYFMFQLILHKSDFQVELMWIISKQENLTFCCIRSEHLINYKIMYRYNQFTFSIYHNLYSVWCILLYWWCFLTINTFKTIMCISSWVYIILSTQLTH